MRSLLSFAEFSIRHAVLLAVIFIVVLAFLLIVIFSILIELILIALSILGSTLLLVTIVIIFLVLAYVFLSFLGLVVENDKLGEHLENFLSVAFLLGNRVVCQVQVLQLF